MPMCLVFKQVSTKFKGQRSHAMHFLICRGIKLEVKKFSKYVKICVL